MDTYSIHLINLEHILSLLCEMSAKKSVYVSQLYFNFIFYFIIFLLNFIDFPVLQHNNVFSKLLRQQTYKIREIRKLFTTFASVLFLIGTVIQHGHPCCK